jgi:hypothetical protein
MGPPAPLKSGRPRANHLQLPLPTRATAIGNRQDQDHRICTTFVCSKLLTWAARGFGPALLFVLLMLRVHLFDDCKLGDIAARQMKSHRPPLGMV